MASGTPISDLLDFVDSDISSILWVNLRVISIDKTAEEVLTLKPMELARLLFDKKVSGTLQIGLADAHDLQAFIRRCFGDSPQEATAHAVAISMPAPNVTVDVKIPANFDQMNLKDALNFVNENKKDEGVKLKLLGRQDIQKAVRLAGTDAIFVPSAQNTIAVGETMDVISGLCNGDPYSQNSNGNFLLSLNMVLGSVVFQYIHPFDGSKLASNKKDALGLDFGDPRFTTEKFEAYVWLLTKPEGVPSQLIQAIERADHFDLYNDVINDGVRTLKVLEYFRHAKNTLRLSAMAVDVIYRERYQVATRTPAKPSLTFSDLRQFSIGDVVSGNPDKTIEPTIVSSIRSGNGDIFCRSVICLGTIKAGNGDISGTIYCPLQTQAIDGNGSVDAKLIRLSEDKLVAKAIELALVQM